MYKCILHAGIPKTGSTSIQAFLAKGISDPGYVYAFYPAKNVNHVLANLFLDCPEKYIWNQNRGLSSTQIRRRSKSFRRYLDSIVAKAIKKGATLILSSELCTSMTDRELGNLKSYLNAKGFDVEVILYFREYKSYQESALQQVIKQGKSVLPVSFKNGYQAIMDKFDTVFGASQVHAYKFDPSLFPNGCVVRHFCETIGLKADYSRIQRENDGLKLPLMKLLFAYNKFAPKLPPSPRTAGDNFRFLTYLKKENESFSGPSLRLHSRFFEANQPDWEREAKALENRMGFSLQDDRYRYDQDPFVIKGEQDLFEFDQHALNWLAARLGEQPVAPVSGEEAARQVAMQMYRLRLTFHESLWKRLGALAHRVLNRSLGLLKQH